MELDCPVIKWIVSVSFLVVLALFAAVRFGDVELILKRTIPAWSGPKLASEVILFLSTKTIQETDF